MHVHGICPNILPICEAIVLVYSDDFFDFSVVFENN